MRKLMSGLLRSSRAVMLLAVLVAVVGVSGTAYANKGSSGDKKGAVAAGKQLHKLTVSHGGRIHKSHKAHKSHKKHNGDNDNDGNHGDNNQGDDHHGDNDQGDDHHGDDGDHHGAEYGVATVNVSRGHTANGQNPATVWATYSTVLGSPVGDTTGGTFRFTCSTANAPCTISVAAAVLGSSDRLFYPRVLVYKQGDGDGGGGLVENYCEYGDGSAGSAPVLVTHQPLSAHPTYAPELINIGGSADCDGPVATAGDVAVITVPHGYYDVHSTFSFFPLP